MARLVFECQDAEECVVFFVSSEKEGKELAASYGASKQWLLENGLTPVKASVKRMAGNPLSAEKTSKGNGKVQFDGQHCPKCGGSVWDNRLKKQENSTRNKWPDFSCRDKSGCQWAIWPGQYEMAQAPS